MTATGAPPAPPPDPGWYADAHGAWWWWDGASWTPASGWGPGAAAAPAAGRSQERTTAMIMWIVFLVGGGWIAALVFYLVSAEKPFVRHHAAEALNLTLLLVPLRLVSLALLGPGVASYLREVIDSVDSGSTFSLDLGPLFWTGLGLSLVLSLVTFGVGIVAVVASHRGRWWRLPLPFHPVHGVVPAGEEPYSVV